jgi:uncharacterized protein (TIGR02145 family)
MTKLITIPILLWIFIFSLSSCNKDEVEESKPSLTTAQIISITATTAIGGGSITIDGGAPIINRGVIWSPSQNPTLVNNAGITIDGNGTGSFSSNLTSLTPNTTYYVRAYATNIVGTAYGTLQTFITLNGIVELTTSAISNITLTSATCGGTITYDGGAQVTARGVIWSVAQNPSIDSYDGKTTDGSGSGNFTSSLTGLSPNTTYYIRAYATNCVGTTYGNEIKLKTIVGSISDSDGNIYYPVTIGSQVWMDENLKTTKYNDGTSIPNIINATDWNTLTTGAYCDYNNTPSYSNIYGRLYNYYAVVDSRKLCPTGWHVPTDAEYGTLAVYLGGGSVAGGKLKEMGITHWNSPNTEATNETGFSALPGGFRHYSGTYGGIGSYGFWWTGSEDTAYSAWVCAMFYNNGILGHSSLGKTNGYAVRCLKD